MSSKNYIFFLFFSLFSLILSMKLSENDFFDLQSVNLIKKVNRLSINSNNINTMLLLTERFKKYINATDIDRKNVTRENFKQVRDKVKNFPEFEDGTYNFYTHEKEIFLKGYQVSFETKFDNYTDSEFDEMVYKMALMTDNNCHIGVYQGLPEISFYIEEFDYAYSAGIIFNQIAVWDFGAKEEIMNPYSTQKNDDD